METNKMSKSMQRIEALRNAGVDVSNLFAMQGAEGGDYVAKVNNGVFEILDDTNPIFEMINKQGAVPNRSLFRRWVMAQMFHMIASGNVTDAINRLGYDYQWKMVIDELKVQCKMVRVADENLPDRARWFNKDVAIAMAEHYIKMLKHYTRTRRQRKCKGVSYITVNKENIFVSDIARKLIRPVEKGLFVIKNAGTIQDLHDAVVAFNKLRVCMRGFERQSQVWKDAYKGSGAFYTIQNLIRFHSVTFPDMDKAKSLEHLTNIAKTHAANGEGYKMLGVLKELLASNNIDVNAKLQEIRTKA
jgi:hypothetical protein